MLLHVGYLVRVTHHSCHVDIYQWQIQDLQTGGGQNRAPPKTFSGILPRKKLILNLKLSNSSHSERHFCSSATHFTSKKHCFWPPTATGGMPPSPWIRHWLLRLVRCQTSTAQSRQGRATVVWTSQLSWLPSQKHTVNVNQCVVKPVTVIRDLGLWFDAELSRHVSWVAQTSFYHLRRIRAVLWQLGRDVTARWITALVSSRLHYCNAVLAGLPASTLAPFQRVLHARRGTHRSVSQAAWSCDSSSSRVAELHWLSVAERIQYKLACWFTSSFWDTRRNIYQTFWHRLPIFQVDLQCVLHRVATSSCRGHVDELATEPCCTANMEQAADGAETAAIDRLVSSWSENISFWFFTGTRIRIDSVMRPLSSSRGRNTSASVTVTVTASAIDANVQLHCIDIGDYPWRVSLNC